jgi:hypothetical protein
MIGLLLSLALLTPPGIHYQGTVGTGATVPPTYPVTLSGGTAIASGLNTAGVVAYITTGSFTPPNASWLVVAVSNPGNTTTPTITDSLGSPLTYTLKASAIQGTRGGWIFLAPVTTGAAMTITATGGAASEIAVAVYALTTSGASVSVGDIKTITQTAGTSYVVSINPTVSGSFIAYSNAEDGNGGSFTGMTNTVSDATGSRLTLGFNSAATVSGTPYSIGFTSGGAGLGMGLAAEFLGTTP